MRYFEIVIGLTAAFCIDYDPKRHEAHQEYGQVLVHCEFD